ncbi:hypothetical protein D9619_001309 [Psilocybe cf. subviscida]|uniref:Uncharacterized protein n=1 Tax=Psilocybe cf. subviscida TaxID=2480587 RepID=A0A8H5F3Z6_9AGAR|nr:hypothetical protein D9619_001309 [Psilocybe cf. subviscida]
MALTRVCSAWRSAVLSSPPLWATLYLRVKSIDHDSIFESVRTVQNWFLRASGAPKKFCLYVDCPIPSGTPSYTFQLFLKAINPSLVGLTCLAIGSRNWARLMMQFVDIEWDVSQLQRLEILGQYSSAENPYLAEEMTKLASVAERITLFKNAKHLTTMVSAQQTRAFGPSFAFLPRGQLTDISIQEGFIHHTALLDTLKQFPQLRKARFTCSNLFLTAAPTAFVHENLASLLLYVAKSNAREFFTFFSSNCILLNLKNLRISIQKMPKVTQLQNQIYNVTPLPSLEYLDLTGDIRIPTDLLLSLLRGVPNLQGLSVDVDVSDGEGRSTDVNKIFASMTIKDGSYDMLPCLTQCSFFGVTDAPGPKLLLDANVIGLCINSRFASPLCQPLKEVALGGRFRFLVNLQDEVARLSRGRNQVKILVSYSDDIFGYSALDALDFEVPFSMEYTQHPHHQF